MTQRIVNQPSETLVEVLIRDLNEWPKEWGGWAVATRIGTTGFGVWFCHTQPRQTRPAGWLDLGTIEVNLDALPCDHLHAIVSREYWLAHGLKSPNRRRGSAAEHAKDMVEFDRLMSDPSAVKVENQATQCEYYECPVDHPQNPRQDGQAYVANCEDIIQALGLTFDEGCEFKSLWRRARARQGFVKAESTALRDAEKAHHYSGRVLAFERRKANK